MLFGIEQNSLNSLPNIKTLKSCIRIVFCVSDIMHESIYHSILNLNLVFKEQHLLYFVCFIFTATVYKSDVNIENLLNFITTLQYGKINKTVMEFEK